MTPLPPALAAWGEPLSLFPRELALSLGPCIRRLAQAVGPLHRPAEEVSVDPNGYDGLARRGSYERLLVSEWLLADEVPDEFLRRAAQREHAFLSLSFRRPGGSRRSLALFDAGPELIGEPRIGQLAALVVLCARARRDGAAFAWGVLQDGDRRATVEVTPASILRLLYARTARAAREEDAAGWAAAEGAPLATDDLWVIGSGRSVSLGSARASRIELEDPLSPGRRDLLATVRRPGAPPRPVELPLPPRPDCVRLVRDPFSARRAAAPTALLSPANGVAFAQNGRRILVRHRDGAVSAHPVPNSPRMPPGYPKTFALREGETLVAAGWMRGARVVLVQTGAGFHLHGLQRGDGPPLYALQGTPHFTAATAPAPLAPLLQVSGGAVEEDPRGVAWVFQDGEGRLFKLGGGAGRTVTLMLSDVLAYAERDGALHVIRGLKTSAGYAVLHSVNVADASVLRGTPGLRAFFGCNSPWVAVEREVDRWEIFGEGRRSRRYTLVAPSGCEVFGVAPSPRNPGEPALLIIDPDRRSVRVISREEHLPFPRASSPIIFAVANGRGPEIATLRIDGTVTVASLAYKQKVLELRPAEAGAELQALPSELAWDPDLEKT